MDDEECRRAVMERFETPERHVATFRARVDELPCDGELRGRVLSLQVTRRLNRRDDEHLADHATALKRIKDVSRRVARLDNPDDVEGKA